MASIDRTISIEEFVSRYPAAVDLLIRQGLPCRVSIEPEWGTLEEMVLRHGRTADQVDRLVGKLNHGPHTELQ
jgi:hypothetical protein